MHPHRNASGKLQSNRNNGFLSPSIYTQGDKHMVKVASIKPTRMLTAKDNSREREACANVCIMCNTFYIITDFFPIEAYNYL